MMSGLLYQTLDVASGVIAGRESPQAMPWHEVDISEACEGGRPHKLTTEKRGLGPTWTTTKMF